ncbi:hypothetical protein tb265_42510 [Gemmatimonadetes bacterium T265]|nr:hypothetical protein tb265_42510 [Gemmatimonadetes bacterium T265]
MPRLRLAVFVTLTAFAGLVADRAGAQRIEHYVSPDSSLEQWTIHEPVVTQPVYPYPTIRFRPGDAIKVQAGGCVQTGGSGATWKRYVNPSGPESDRLYHGLIWIPGVIGAPWPALARLADVNGHTLAVPANVNVAQAYLRLGYVDDDYRDNGYANHDDGTENQCRGQSNAVVQLIVTHGAGGTVTPPVDSAPLPFDLISDSLDDNLMPLNPMWGYQKLHHGLPPSAETLCADTIRSTAGVTVIYAPDQMPCTRQATFRDDAHICGPHGNWGPATVTGPITWESHSTGTFSGDDDYSWYLDPPNGNGLTATRKTLEPEFKAAETIDQFSTPWWQDFHLAVDNGGTGPNTLIDGKFAIVSGLFGLDFEHSIHAEVHPVFAMAVRVKEDPADETWMFFVRRFGNEGFCSSHIHYLDYLPDDQFVFRLPLLWGSAATLGGQDLTFVPEHPAPDPAVTFVPGQGVLITVAMSENPAARQLIHGELHLHWTNADPVRVRARRPIARATHPANKEEGVEEYYGELVHRMTPAQQARLRSMVPDQPTPRPSGTARVTHAFTVATQLPRRTTRTRRPAVRSVLDPDKVARDEAFVAAVHTITGASLQPPARERTP